MPSFTLLSRIGQELGVPIGFFVEAEQDARQVDERLVEALSHTSIPKRIWPEILGLSLEGRKAVAKYLAQQQVQAYLNQRWARVLQQPS